MLNNLSVLLLSSWKIEDSSSGISKIKWLKFICSYTLSIPYNIDHWAYTLPQISKITVFVCKFLKIFIYTPSNFQNYSFDM